MAAPHQAAQGVRQGMLHVPDQHKHHEKTSRVRRRSRSVHQINYNQIFNQHQMSTNFQYSRTCRRTTILLRRFLLIVRVNNGPVSAGRHLQQLVCASTVGGECVSLLCVFLCCR